EISSATDFPVAAELDPDTPEEDMSSNKPEQEGTVLSDTATQADYKVISRNGEEPAVEYKSSTSSGKKTITVPATVTVGGVTYEVTKIADGAFRNNKTITKVTIGKNVETVGSNAFAGCKKLKTVKIGNHVTEVEKGAFQNCSSLKTVTMGSNVERISENAFAKCTQLTKLTLPATLAELGKNVFHGCTRLKTIRVNTKKLSTKNVSNKAFNGVSSKTVIKVPKTKKKEYTTLFRKKGLSKKVKIQ
ncbi:MAG: leucine-rich repeat domain-containing protein, partial [Lachnospiraceae bacterium]|nr:leucine-rich repeat domain-containing protein [Lachnospiraceae bacterium]